MYIDETVTDKIEILEDGQIQVREATRVLRDGVVIATTYHRRVMSPADDVTKADKRVAAVAAVVWTPEVVTAWQEKMNKKPVELI